MIFYISLFLRGFCFRQFPTQKKYIAKGTQEKKSFMDLKFPLQSPLYTETFFPDLSQIGGCLYTLNINQAYST